MAEVPRFFASWMSSRGRNQLDFSMRENPTPTLLPVSAVTFGVLLPSWALHMVGIFYICGAFTVMATAAWYMYFQCIASKFLQFRNTLLWHNLYAIKCVDFTGSFMSVGQCIHLCRHNSQHRMLLCLLCFWSQAITGLLQGSADYIWFSRGFI